MPPKKKSVTTKIQKQEAPKEIITDPKHLQLKRIPKGPIFRRNVEEISKRPIFQRNVEDDGRIHQKIRVKLWKLHSCELEYFSLKSPTSKKSFKHLKKLKVDSYRLRNESSLSKFYPFLKFCESLKLDSLHFVYYPNLTPKSFRIFRAFRNSRLRNCFLSEFPSYFSEGNYIEPKFLSAFRRFRKCNLFLRLPNEEVDMLLNTEKLRSWKKLNQSGPIIPNSETEGLGNWVIEKIPESLQKIASECKRWRRNQDKILNLPRLPNLQKLSSVLNDYRCTIDISFLKNLPKLESLKIQFQYCIPDSFNPLADLPCLKELHFSWRQDNTQRGYIIDLPKLANIQIIRMEIIQLRLSAISKVQSFLLSNQNLRTLDLSLTSQKLGLIFEGENFLLPHLETLLIDIKLIQKPYVEEVKNFAQGLKKHHFIKKLQIQLEESHTDFNQILLQEGLAHMKSLEDLTLKYEKVGGMKGKKFEHLKDVWANLVNLTSLELDVSSDIIRPQDIKSFLEDLGQLKNLKKFWLSARFLKLTRANLDQLLGLLVSMRDVKNLRIKLQGISEKDEKELKNNLFIKSALATGAFSFDSRI